jgi:hypothetical protein
MALNTAALNAEATTLATDAAYLSLHTADPGATGTNETSAARVAAAWGGASGGAITTSSKNFTGGAASGACTYVGLWSASTAGTFYGGFALSGDQTFNAAGQYTLTSLTITGTAS